jgi:hypothetical protein
LSIGLQSPPGFLNENLSKKIPQKKSVGIADVSVSASRALVLSLQGLSRSDAEENYEEDNRYRVYCCDDEIGFHVCFS